MKTLKWILENTLVIASIAYLWVLPFLGYKETIQIQPYHIAFAILAVGIYLGDKISTVKDKQAEQK